MLQLEVGLYCIESNPRSIVDSERTCYTTQAHLPASQIRQAGARRQIYDVEGFIPKGTHAPAQTIGLL